VLPSDIRGNASLRWVTAFSGVMGKKIRAYTTQALKCLLTLYLSHLQEDRKRVTERQHKKDIHFGSRKYVLKA
jgi:hypothetical protein